MLAEDNALKRKIWLKKYKGKRVTATGKFIAVRENSTYLKKLREQKEIAQENQDTQLLSDTENKINSLKNATEFYLVFRVATINNCTFILNLDTEDEETALQLKKDKVYLLSFIINDIETHALNSGLTFLGKDCIIKKKALED